MGLAPVQLHASEPPGIPCVQHGMRALLLLLALGITCVAEESWAAFTPCPVTRDNLPAVVRDWYRFSWQGVIPPIATGGGWKAARVSGDLVLCNTGSQEAILVRDDGLIELRPLSAEEMPAPPSGEDLARCAWTATILTTGHADPPLLPTALRITTTASEGFSLRWETAKNRGRFLGFKSDGTAPSYGGWGSRTISCRSTCGSDVAFSLPGNG